MRSLRSVLRTSSSSERSLVGLQCCCVDLGHEMRAALQVEAERDLLFGDPARQRRELLGREHVGKRGEHAGKDKDDVSHHDPSWGTHVC